jgi:iron complex transport system substrate-binding protein
MNRLMLLLCLLIAPAVQATGIVIAGGSLTEIVYALGAGREITAVDTTSTYPKETKQLKKIGYPRALSTEGILSTHPGLLILSQEAGPPAVIQKIKDAKIPVLILPTDYSFEGLLERIRIIGDSTGRQNENLTQKLETEWQETKKHINTLQRKNPKKPRVIFLLAHSGTPMIAGGDTAANAMIHLAGGINPMAAAFSGYKPMTPEALITAAPDFLLVTTEGLQHIGNIKTHAPIIHMDAIKLLGFGPRLPMTVRELGEWFYEKSR